MTMLSGSQTFLKATALTLSMAFAAVAAPVEAAANQVHKSYTVKKHAFGAKPIPAGTVKHAIGEAKYAITINGETGDDIECKNCEEVRPPASLTKLVTALVVFDAIRAGKLKYSDRLPLIKATEIGDEGALTLQKGGGQGKSYRPPIPVGTLLTVQELLSATSTLSAADAAGTLAVKVAGSEQAFVDLMNQKVATIFAAILKDDPKGLHTHFANTSGMADADNYTNAKQMAEIVRYMIKYYPDESAYFAQKQFPIAGHVFDGHNPLLFSYKRRNALGFPYEAIEMGKTGLFRNPKPGQGPPAGSCFAGSAVWKNYRVIVVALGEANGGIRDTKVTQLLDSAFEQLESKKIPGTEAKRVPLHVPSLPFIRPRVAPEEDQSRLPAEAAPELKP